MKNHINQESLDALYQTVTDALASDEAIQENNTGWGVKRADEVTIITLDGNPCIQVKDKLDAEGNKQGDIIYNMAGLPSSDFIQVFKTVVAALEAGQELSMDKAGNEAKELPTLHFPSHQVDYCFGQVALLELEEKEKKYSLRADSQNLFILLDAQTNTAQQLTKAQAQAFIQQALNNGTVKAIDDSGKIVDGGLWTKLYELVEQCINGSGEVRQNGKWTATVREGNFSISYDGVPAADIKEVKMDTYAIISDNARTGYSFAMETERVLKDAIQAYPSLHIEGEETEKRKKETVYERD